MVDISDLVLEIDSAMRWPSARRWLTENYGTNAYIQLMALHTDRLLEPNPPPFVERWAMIVFTIAQRCGAHHTHFYLDFQDPDEEMIFRLKWL